MSDKVVPLTPHIQVDLSALPKANETLVQALEKILEEARSGRMRGVMLVPLYSDYTSAYWLAGEVGSYSMLGAAQVGVYELMSICRE